jgi:predicted lipoprotein with Yx(FWY)xxD motif
MRMRSIGTAGSNACPRYTAAAVAALVAAAVAVATGLGPGEGRADDSTTTAPLPPAQPAPTPLPTIDAAPTVGATWLNSADTGALGAIVVNDTGRTVYVFGHDTPMTSACYGACADTWLPVLTFGDPAGGNGIDDSQVEAMPRQDGNLQVTYFGHPLYYYAGDTASGQVNGQNLDVFGGRWSVVDPNGHATV